MLGVCTWSHLLMVGVACLSTLKTGWSAAVQTVPDSGSIIAGSVGDKNITVFCEVFDGRDQQLTTWFRQFLNGSRDGITIGDPNFAFDGEPVPGFNTTFDTNLTILTLTEDLDRSTIFCGETGMNSELIEAANFIIRIYRPPNLRDITQSVCEERNGAIDLQAAGAEEAFPFPQEFNWTRDGETVDNTTDGGRVTYGYPSVAFTSFTRNDSGRYVLTAANYEINGSLIGNDTGSFTLNVQYFDDGDDRQAVLVGGNITLVCATNVDSNPQVTVQWRDPMGNEVSDGGRYTLNNGPEIVNLAIDNVNVSDHGNWSCTVSVNASCDTFEQERFIMLTVVVAPSQPTNVDVDQFGITATSVRFCWQLPNNLGMPNVSQYRVVVDPPSFLGESEFFTEERFLDVTDLLPGTTHEFTVYARSVSGDIIAESGPSETVRATTDTTVPAPNCFSANPDDGVIVITFSFTHTGGLNLTAVSIDYREQRSPDFQELESLDVNEINLIRNNVEVFNFNLTAGLTYIFRVNASNEAGYADDECPPLVDCGAPETPLNGSVNFNTTALGAMVEIVCDEGFMLGNGTNTSVCSEDGEWDPVLSMLQCVPQSYSVDCYIPNPPRNGSVYLDPNNTTTLGATVEIMCNGGFTLQNNTSMSVCSEDGEWDPVPSMLQCVPQLSTTGLSEPVRTAIIVVVAVILLVGVVIAIIIAVVIVVKRKGKYSSPRIEQFERYDTPLRPPPAESGGTDLEISNVMEDSRDSKSAPRARISYADVILSPIGSPPPTETDTVQYSTLLTSELAKPRESVHPADKKLNIDSVLLQLREVHDYWYQLGEALGVPTFTLDEVSLLCTTPEVSMVEVIDLWMRSHTGRLTWQEVSDALRKINLTHLSTSIEQVYTTGTLPVVVDVRAPLPLPNRRDDTPPPLPPRGDSPEMSHPFPIPPRGGDSPKQPPSEEAPPPRPPKQMPSPVDPVPPIPPKPTQYGSN